MSKPLQRSANCGQQANSHLYLVFRVTGTSPGPLIFLVNMTTSSPQKSPQNQWLQQKPFRPGSLKDLISGHLQKKFANVLEDP